MRLRVLLHHLKMGTKESKTSCSKLLQKFRGSLVGAVVGDCVGGPFEGSQQMHFQEVEDFINDVKKRDPLTRSQILRFTDDTAMARSVAKSFIAKKQFDADDMAKRFSQEYFSEPGRGYGGNVVTVFCALRDGVEDVFQPAREQFGGQGSYGNGGAMRVAPTALYGYTKSTQELEEISRKTALLTHSHQDSINGTILQCHAVHQALHTETETLKQDEFLEKLIEKMKSVEVNDDKVPRRPKRDSERQPQPYCYKLQEIQKMLKEDVPCEKVIEVLGTDISALGSVPTAVYSFLRCTEPVHGITTSNPFERILIYAISLGGDTDTIATMAGAIAGAYYGIDVIPKKLQEVCEGRNDALTQAKELFDHFANQ